MNALDVKSSAGIPLFSLNKHEDGMKYLLFLPTSYVPTTKLTNHLKPLIVCLHGSGGINNEEKVRSVGLVKKLLTADHSFLKSFPFVVLAPIADARNWENCFDKVLPIVDTVVAENSVDVSQVYVTGFSMGGHGAWRLCSLYPSRFAAVVPVCGYLDRSNKNKIKDAKQGGTEIPLLVSELKEFPIWVFHAADDVIIPVEFSDHIVKKLREVGNEKVIYTRYETAPPMVVNGKEYAGHASYEICYSDPGLYKWLLQHRREENKPTNVE